MSGDPFSSRVRVPADLLDQLIGALSVSPKETLTRLEVKMGHEIVPVGSVPWLPEAEWDTGSLVFRDGDEIRLVAILANQKWTGAFRRLVAGIEAAGLRPVIISPLADMERIMDKWGWSCRRIGDDFATAMTEWRPVKRPQAVTLGDMMLIGKPPAKLVKALAVISDSLHQEFAKEKWIKPNEHSKRSCILCSLAVRDFLQRIGFLEAEIAPVLFAIQATDVEGKLLHSLGVGTHDLDEARKNVSSANGWPGHMIVRLPKAGWLIDTTLYQANRPQWSSLPGMMCVPLKTMRGHGRYYGLKPISGMSISVEDKGRIDFMWLDQPKNTFFKGGPDMKREHRKLVVELMVSRFGKWEG